MTSAACLVDVKQEIKKSVHPSKFSKIFSKTARPIKAKIPVEQSLDLGNKRLYINGPGHMVFKMAAMPIHGKILFFRSRSRMILKLKVCMGHWGLTIKL